MCVVLKGRLFLWLRVWCLPGPASSSPSNCWHHSVILELSFGHCAQYLSELSIPPATLPVKIIQLQLQVTSFFKWKKQKITLFNKWDLLCIFHFDPLNVKNNLNIRLLILDSMEFILACYFCICVIKLKELWKRTSVK